MSWSLLDVAAHELVTLLGRGAGAPAPPPSFARASAIVVGARRALPLAYRHALIDPLWARLRVLGPLGYDAQLHAERSPVGLLLAALAPYERGLGLEGVSTAAAQELISDIYDGFLSTEERRGFSSPERVIVPPLVAWDASEGPAYYPPAALSLGAVGVGVGLVVMPEVLRAAGLWAWPLIAHEVAGHDVLLANRGLIPELSARVRARLVQLGLGDLAGYWSERVHEVAADVLGVLNIGPTFGISIIAYLSALHGLSGGTRSLRRALEDDRYPVDVLRAWAVCEVVGRLDLRDAEAWRRWLLHAVARDGAAGVWIEGRWVSAQRAWASAHAVASVIAGDELSALGDRAFEELQNWGDADQEVTELISAWLKGQIPGPPRYGDGYYAAHAIAATIQAELASAAGWRGGVRPSGVLPRALELCAAMHRENPVWMGAPRVLPSDR